MSIRSLKAVSVGVVLLAVIAVSILIAAPVARPAPAAAPDGMVLVKGGIFRMGDVRNEGPALVKKGYSWVTNEKPVHNVTLADFYMGKHEVTWALWKKVCDWAIANGYEFENAGAVGYKPESDPEAKVKEDLARDEDAPEALPVPDGTHPVTTVSWYDVVKWCNAYSEMEKRTPVYYTGSAHRSVYKTDKKDLKPAFVKWDANGYRLPTEAEWEYAAAGGHLVVGANKQPAVYAGGDELDAVGWYNKNSGSQTHSVGKKQANALGIFDMSGNVWEWCYDWYGPYTAAAKTNPRGAATGQCRVLRGGAFNFNVDVCRAAIRYNFAPVNAYFFNGFRLVSSARR